MNVRAKHGTRFPRAFQGLLLVLLFNTLPAYSQNVYNVPQLPIPMENTSQGARATALGSAFTAVSGDGSSLYMNPAGLAFLHAAELSTLYQTLNGNITQGTLRTTFPLSHSGSLALGWDALSYAPLAGQDAGGNSVSFSPFRSSLSLGLGFSLGPSLALGISARYGYYWLSNNADSISSSLSGGLLWRANDFWDLGAFYSNYDPQDPAGTGVAKIGSAWSGPFLGKDISLVTLDLSFPTNNLNQVQLGLEQRFLGDFALRAGYDLDLESAPVSSFQGLSAGFGLRLSPFDLNYALSPMGDLGLYQAVDLTWSWPEKNDLRPSSPATPSPTPTPTVKPRQSASPTPTIARLTTIPAQLTSLTPSVDPTPLPVLFKPAPDDAAAVSMEVKKVRFELPDTQTAASVTPSADLDAKIQVLSAQVAQNPKDDAAWVALGNLYWKNGQADFAAQAFEEALSITPQDPSLVQWLNNYKAKTAAGNKTPTSQTIK
jgi:hypothetical protein